MAPIFVPATPGGELAKEVREIARSEAINGVKFKIVEWCFIADTTCYNSLDEMR